jgi:soluble lytic murein transglycosylase
MMQAAKGNRSVANDRFARARFPLIMAGALAVVASAAADRCAAAVHAPIAGTSRQLVLPHTGLSARASGGIEVSARKKARAKPAAKSRGTPKAASKPAAKPEANSATKSAVKLASKPETKATSVPLPPSRPGAATAATAGLAPPVAAALRPSLPNDVLPPTDQAPPSAPALPQDPGPAAPPAQTRSPLPPPANTIIKTAAMDVAALKRAIEMVRSRKQSAATDVKKSIADPVAQDLIEWVILRSDDAGASFARYAAFINARPHWPSLVTLRRKAEAMAFQDRPDASGLRAYFEKWPPLSAKGRFAFARALLQQGERARAEALIREAWRNDGFSQDVEKRVLDAYGEMLTRADHKARMNRRLYEENDTEAGLRMAQRLGGHEPAIAKARIAMLNKKGGSAAVEAVPAAAREDIGYKFARLQMLRRNGKYAEAAKLMRTVPKLDGEHDLDEWWIERRLLARELLEAGDAKSAYEVASGATPPERDNYRVEHQFTAGWIALRFLHDAATAYEHFRQIPKLSENPISLSRGYYWLGRAAEALNRPQEARRHYQEAARYPTAYYGQIARAKIGLGELTLNPFPTLTAEQRARATSLDIVRAVELLYAVEARDLAWTMLADLGDKSDDLAVLTLLAEITAKYRDARGMLLVGKLALARGYALDHAAFPNIGVPDYTPIGPQVEPAIVYAIVRQESWFNPRTISSAKAMGLMQVTPPAGRYIAKKFGVTYDQNRLLSDLVYNVQMGAAEIGDVIKDYRGSYIMAFAAYNAGRGRVRDWVARFGDPRDPKVDPIDWVERIPFSETRNYVQRVMENLQVYRVRFGGSPRLLIEADLRRGSAAN